ncbi:MAG TPA: hypothetical protein VLV45_02950 [Gemmatimonadales bacterium]|nr:hypothetical protein [Gemmatimonadales bacterium]
MRSVLGRSLLLMLVCWGPLAPRPGAAQTRTMLRQAQDAYDALDFSRAAVLARRALTERLSAADQTRAYELLGFSYSAIDSQIKAVDAFKQTILLDPDHQLDANKVSPKITSLFYSALGQVLVVRQLRVDSAKFVSGQGAVPIRFTVTSPARIRVRAVNANTSLAVDSAVGTGQYTVRWPAQLPSGGPVGAGTWLLIVDATAAQTTFSASQAVNVSYGAVDTLPHLTSLPGYQELPEIEYPPQSWRPLGLSFLLASGAAVGAYALNNGSLGSPPTRELAVAASAALITGLIMTLRKPAPRPAEANIRYNRLLHEQLSGRNAEIATENARRRQQVMLAIVPQRRETATR